MPKRPKGNYIYLKIMDEFFEECTRCAGSGFIEDPNGEELVECPKCGGEGIVERSSINEE